MIEFILNKVLGLQGVTKNYTPFKLNRFFNPLSANRTKWSNTRKHFVGNLPTICVSVFDHFLILVLKGLKDLIYISKAPFNDCYCLCLGWDFRYYEILEIYSTAIKGLRVVQSR